MHLFLKLFIFYLFILNLYSFFLMGADKQKAIQHQWRISEKPFFLCAILGGSVGSILGMYFFHHKTKHWYFVFGMPIILFLQIFLFLIVGHILI